ncbi:MAG TPA: hypothetical protein V6C91_17235 [Coleofasciculaceae cyanobacterium]
MNHAGYDRIIYSGMIKLATSKCEQSGIQWVSFLQVTQTNSMVLLEHNNLSGSRSQT